MDAIGLETTLAAESCALTARDSEPGRLHVPDADRSLDSSAAHAASSRPGNLRDAFSCCADALYRFILVRACGDRHTAEDLLQQTCLEAARTRKAPDDAAGCEAFLFGIARNLLRKHWRRMKRRGLLLPQSDAELGAGLTAMMEAGPLAPEVLAGRETRDQLLLAITALPAADQQLVFAFYFDGRSYLQIAQELGSSSKSIESRLYRLRTRLRAALRGKEHENYR